MLAWVKQLSARHTGQHQVGGIRLEIDVHLYGVRVNGRRRVAFFGVVCEQTSEEKCPQKLCKCSYFVRAYNLIRVKLQVDSLEHYSLTSTGDRRSNFMVNIGVNFSFLGRGFNTLIKDCHFKKR